MIRQFPRETQEYRSSGSSGSRKPELLQLLERRLEPPLQFRRSIGSAHADVLAGERPQVEIKPGSPVEPFIEEAEHPLGRRQAEPEIELEIQLLEIAAPKALEDHLVPAKAGEGQGVALGARLLGSTTGRRFRARLARLAAGPFAPLAVVEGDVVQDVEVLVDPALRRVVPPGVLIHQHDADPAVERLLDPPIAGAALRPAEQLDQLVSRERNLGAAEIPPHRQLDQADQDLVVDRRREAVLDRPHDRQFPDDRRVVVTLQFVFENERRPGRSAPDPSAPRSGIRRD